MNAKLQQTSVDTAQKIPRGVQIETASKVISRRAVAPVARTSARAFYDPAVICTDSA